APSRLWRYLSLHLVANLWRGHASRNHLHRHGQPCRHSHHRRELWPVCVHRHGLRQPYGRHSEPEPERDCLNDYHRHHQPTEWPHQYGLLCNSFGQRWRCALHVGGNLRRKFATWTVPYRHLRNDRRYVFTVTDAGNNTATTGNLTITIASSLAAVCQPAGNEAALASANPYAFLLKGT